MAKLKKHLAKTETELLTAKKNSCDEQKRSQTIEAQRISEERYRSLFENMTEGFALHEIICDENGKPCD